MENQRSLKVSKSDFSADKCRQIAIDAYQADNREGRENIGGWRKDCRTNKSEKYRVISKHKVHYLTLNRVGDGKWTQELKVHVVILSKKSKNLKVLVEIGC